MILSGLEIEKKLGKEIIIEPFDKNRLNPNSYNLRLHNKLLRYKNPTLDMKTAHETEEIIIEEDGILLQPNELYLGRTIEYTESHDCVPMLEGRSSVGRLGLFIHITAGFGDVGFCGYWTLEIFCIKPIRVYPNVEICQVYYHDIKGEYEKYQSNKYQHNQEVQPSMLYKDFIK
ncbi:MAG: dCTP deaminase [Bacteroidetes bacterium]|nr:MAG: dCTP deaminase [Bacteroidota bacterium]TAG85919.1 MAG: dCTP deaminase [Bacteroidota bacterium]